MTMKGYIFIFYFTLLVSSFAYGQSHTTLSGQIDNLNKDTLVCELLVNGIIRQFEIHKIPINNKKFELDLQIKTSYLLSIKDGENYINGIIEPGDKICISYDAKDAEHSLNIEGSNKEKFELFNSLTQDKINKKISERVPVAKEQKYPFDYLYNFIDSIEIFYLKKLELLKKNISSASYQLLKGEIKGAFLAKKYYSFNNIYSETASQTLKTRDNELTVKTRNYLKKALLFEETYSNSSTYLHNVYNILDKYYNEQIATNKQESLQNKYRYISGILPAKFRKQVLTLFLNSDLKKIQQQNEIDALMNSIYKTTADSVYRKYINNRYQQLTSLKDNMDAPDFLVEDETGKTVNLASFKGKVVFMDFWFAACGPCHALFEQLRPVKEHFKDNNKVVFLTVSVDDKDVWKKALKKYSLEGYQVFTQNKGREHSIISDYKVAGYPTTYLIGANGKIFRVRPSSNPDELTKQIEDALIVGSN